MSNLVLVAIPAEDDYVHKISSEKVPHCTLLFLGDVANKPIADIANFIQHAVSVCEHGPFNLSVDYRGVLGADEADVVFFRDDWSLKWIKEFRGLLLKDNNIKAAYDSADQFPVWQPHLTLGYPDTPAHKDERDYPGVRWVEFDRIALWFGDFEGLEFRLEYNWDMEVAMSGTTSEKGAAFIEHYGVKGMRWGVRRDHAGVVTTTSRTNAGLLGKTKVKAKGGRGEEATADAVKAAEKKQKLRKSGTAALSNQDLRELAERMRLEVEVKRLDAETQSGGKKFVKKLLGENVKRSISGETASFVDRTIREAKARK